MFNQQWKFLRDHAVASSVFLGTKGLDSLVSSVSLAVEKRCMDSSLGIFVFVKFYTHAVFALSINFCVVL